MPPFPRLSSVDLMALRFESPSTPFHIGAVAILEGDPLHDAAGRLRLEEVRGEIENRLPRVPELRRRLYRPGLLGGRPLWVDDAEFDLRRHVRVAGVDPPGGEAQLLETAGRLFARLLDRRHPLWQLWLLVGLEADRIGMLFKIHHAVADGMAAVAVIRSLFEPGPAPAPRPARPWSPGPPPGASALRSDHLSSARAATLRTISGLAHPGARLRGATPIATELVASLRRPRAARTSLNRPVQPGRRIAALRLDHRAFRELARSAGVRMNDLVLDVYAEGLRDLLLARGEPPPGGAAQVTTTVAVSLRPGGRAAGLGNRVGVLVVPLHLAEPDVRRRLELIAAATQGAKSDQHAAATMGALGWLAATPAAELLVTHQRWVSVFSTNLAGPRSPVEVLGARVQQVLPIVQVAGNVGLALCAIAYAGQLALVVTADAGAFPDLAVLVAGMERGWRDLAAQGAGSAHVASLSG
jgi:diacylglycerol O-acyltransferase